MRQGVFGGVSSLCEDWGSCYLCPQVGAVGWDQGMMRVGKEGDGVTA